MELVRVPDWAGVRVKNYQRQGRVFLRLGETNPTPRHFPGGSLVRFSPPPGVYSAGCAQHLAARKVGMVIGMLFDYCNVTFGEGTAILCPSYYLESVNDY